MKAPTFSADEKKLLAILATVQFTHILDFMLMMPLGPQLMRLLAIQPDQFSLLVSSYTFCAGVTGLLSAFFLDYFDRKRSLLFFYAGFSLGTLACGLSDDYETLLAARSLTGAFGGILGSLCFSIVGDAIAPEKRGTATGIVMGAFSLASIFGVPFALYLAAHGTWQTPLFVLAGAALLVTILIATSVPSMRRHMQGQKGSPWEFLRTVPFQKRPALAIVLMSTMVLGQFAVIPFLSPSLVANVGLREDQLPYVYLVGGLVSIVSSPLFGRLSDRYGPVQTLLFAAPLSLIPFVLITNLGLVSLPLAILVCALFFFCMGGRMVPTMTIVTGSVLPRNRGAFMSLSSSLQQFAAAFAAFIAGQIVTRDGEGHLVHYEWIGVFAVVLTLIALAIAYQLRREPAQVAAGA